MSSKNLVTCTLVAAGLFLASVPTFANSDSNHSPNAPSTASVHERHDSPRDRGALTAGDQRDATYGVSASSMQASGSAPQAMMVPVARASSHDHGQS